MDAGWVMAEPPQPPTVTVVFRGPYRELLRAVSNEPVFNIPVQEVTDSVELRDLRTEWLRLPPGTPNTVVTSFQPRTVQLSFDRVTTRLIPVAAPLLGDLPPGY